MAEDGLNRFTERQKWELCGELNRHSAGSAPRQSDELRAELDRRAALLDSSRTATHTWTDVKARIQARLREQRRCRPL